jgi:hypothetical protein
MAYLGSPSLGRCHKAYLAGTWCGRPSAVERDQALDSHKAAARSDLRHTAVLYIIGFEQRSRLSSYEGPFVIERWKRTNVSEVGVDDSADGGV